MAGRFGGAAIPCDVAGRDAVTVAFGQAREANGSIDILIQRDRPDEAGYRGDRFTEWPTALQGNNDLLNLTQPQIIEELAKVKDSYNCDAVAIAAQSLVGAALGSATAVTSAPPIARRFSMCSRPMLPQPMMP